MVKENFSLAEQLPSEEVFVHTAHGQCGGALPQRALEHAAEDGTERPEQVAPRAAPRSHTGG